MCRSRTIVPAPASVRPASSPIALISVLRMDANRIAGADGWHRLLTARELLGGSAAWPRNPGSWDGGRAHLAQRSSPVPRQGGSMTLATPRSLRRATVALMVAALLSAAAFMAVSPGKVRAAEVVQAAALPVALVQAEVAGAANAVGGGSLASRGVLV
jgi:hypothetical protein